MITVTDLPLRLVSAPRVELPSRADCNCPAHWADGRLHVFTSHPRVGPPMRSAGPDLFSLGPPAPIAFDNEVNGSRWIESTIPDGGGKLYGWYHNEPRGVCPGTTAPATVGELTAPRIGAAVSEDDGETWHDLGFILEASPDLLDCGAENGYFAGGHGDFCVLLDRAGEWLYVFYSAYAGERADQGVAVARIAWRDRDAPAGKAWKWYEGDWSEPGIGGRLTPTFPPAVEWQRADCDAFWGPSVHWNEHLGRYVMLLNRAKGKGWVQEGIYASFADELADPHAWSEPVKLLDGGSWYPQVIGLDEGGTDKLAGRRARLFMSGVSEHELLFG